MNTLNKNARFGSQCASDIKKAVSENIPLNTQKSKKSIWEQFSQFLKVRNYELDKSTPVIELAKILEDYAFNMKKGNGEDYKETSVKSIWNTTAKMLQEKYFKEYEIKIDPFTDITFKDARMARDTKRKQLQSCLQKRKLSSKALSTEELMKIIQSYNEENPDELQKKFFHLCSFELAWRGNEAVNCKVQYFQKEFDVMGLFTGRIEYNSVFSKTAQGGSKGLTNSKWLVKNSSNINLCPVRLFLKLMEKRGPNITTDRIFLTVHPNWQKGYWFKNTPIGINTMSKWTKTSAERIGIDTKKHKITNHSHRSSAVSALAKQGVGEQELIKLTGHANANSIKPYLQLDSDHHLKLIKSLRTTNEACSATSASQLIQVNQTQNQALIEENGRTTINNYNNCTFNINCK